MLPSIGFKAYLGPNRLEQGLSGPASGGMKHDLKIRRPATRDTGVGVKLDDKPIGRLRGLGLIAVHRKVAAALLFNRSQLFFE